MIPVEVAALTKTFPGVRALDDVSVGFRAGEVHALVGENGAGKSTLIKILAGAYPPDSGEIRVDGEPVVLRNPHDSQRRGLAFIHQEPTLVPAMSVAENMTLGLARARRLGVLVDWREVRRQAAAVAARLRFPVDLATPVGRLGAADQEMVAIGRALLAEARVLVLDEPTASLTDAEVRRLYEVIRDLVAHDVAVIYVSHRLDEIFEIADRVSVLKDGRLVATRPLGEIAGKAELVRLIVGRDVAVPVADHQAERGPVVLSTRNVRRRPRVLDASFDLHAGEILGLTGLVGAGRTELARILFGADARESGVVQLHGMPVHFGSPADAIGAGVAYLPEERRVHGAVTTMSVRENLTLASLRRYRLPHTPGVVNQRSERRRASVVTRRLGVRTPGVERQLALLSGGNQQKVLIGKALDTEAKLFVFDEPTQGIDVGAKEEIYALVRELAEQGNAVLVISSDIEEVIGLCPRVLVMREGVIVADLDHPDESTILAHCYGTALTT